MATIPAPDVNLIDAPQWSMAMSGLGKIVTEIDDIRQCIDIIVRTRKGSSPFWPDFGCGIFDWLDQPMTQAAPRIVRDIETAIKRWETRVVIQDISYTLENDGKMIIKLYWSVASGTNLGAINLIEFGVDNGVVYLVDNFNQYIITPLGAIIL